MSKKRKDIEEKEIKKDEETVKIKKRKNANQRRQFAMKIAGWIMALVMVVGTLMSIFGMLIYYNK